MSTFSLVPTDATNTSYSQVTRLGDRDYSLEFLYSARNETWTLTIGDGEGSPLFAGIPVTCGTDLLRGYHWHPDCPRGYLMVAALTGGTKDPALGELGEDQRAWLVWEPAGA